MRRGHILGIFCTVILGVSVILGRGESSERETYRRVSDSLEVLMRSPTGRALLERSRKQWKFDSYRELVSIFRWGAVSRTDAVLTRHFDPKSGTEERDRRITIYLKRDQALADLVMDMAHEMTHATARPSWDPYDPELTPARYIWTSIEGPGGEADAVYEECQVGLELSARFGMPAMRCSRYVTTVSENQVDRKKILADFYRVGRWSSELRDLLGGEGSRFPLLSAEKPQLFSSTGHAPYPIALLREFEEISEIACANSKKRLSALNAQSAPARAPASDSHRTAQQSEQSLSDFLARRCL